MNRRTFVLTLPLVAVALPAVAHEGHDHKLLGTLTEVAADKIVVKATKDGALSTVSRGRQDQDHPRQDDRLGGRPESRRPGGREHRQRQGAALGQGHSGRPGADRALTLAPTARHRMALPSSVLCPIDFSVHAERALRHAVALCGAFHARLTVVTVNDPMLVDSAAAAGHAGTLQGQVEAALRELMARVPAPPGAAPTLDVATGPAADQILKAAERAHAELIVMGSQGLGGTSKLFFGSTAERVMRTSTMPVLAVPEHSPERIVVADGAARFAPGAIVAAVGFDHLDGVVAATGAEWAAATGAPLVLTHVCHEAPAPGWWPFPSGAQPPTSLDAATAKLAAVAAALPDGAAVEIDVRRGQVPPGVAAVTRDRDAGLLVVSRGGGGHRLGAVAYRIMCEAALPTLVVDTDPRQ